MGRHDLPAANLPTEREEVAAPPLEAPDGEILAYLTSIASGRKREREAFRYACSTVREPTAREFIEKELSIVDLRKHLVALALNRPQAILERLWVEDEGKATGIRWIILKARQEGCSTWIQAHLFESATRGAHVSALTVAHRNKAADKIFSITRRFYRRLRFHLHARFASRREIEFEEPIGSTLTFDSAQNEDVGRAGTLQMLHLSEVAFWPRPDETFTSVMQCCPGTEGSVAIIESTANGASGFFYERWQEANRAGSEWRPIFLPWHIHHEYRLGFGSPREREEFERSLDMEELDLRGKHGLELEQLKWRRWCIQVNCGGSLRKFHQEYPTTPEEAFLTTGSALFDRRRLLSIQSLIVPSIERVDLVPEAPNGRCEFNVVPRAEGPVEVWERPQPGKKYVVGIDSSEGLEEGSRSAVHVMRLEDCVQVAEIDAAGMEIFPFADLCVGLGFWYNEAFTIGEANKDGVAVLARMRDRGYRFLYIERSMDRVTKKVKTRLGWYTSSTSRPIVIALCSDNLQTEDPGIRSKNLLNQLLTYPRAKHSVRGIFTDVADARMLALQGRHEAYHPRRLEDEELPEELKRLPAQDREIWKKVYEEEERAARHAKELERASG